MENTTRRRWSAWKRVGILSGAIIILLALLTVVLSILGNRRFSAMKARLKIDLLAAEKRDHSRPPSRGNGEPGNAWDDYQHALDELKASRMSVYPLADFLKGSAKSDRKIVEALLEHLGEALSYLREGAGRGAARYPYRWEEGDLDIRGVLKSQHLANLAGCQARFMIEAGRPGEAIRVLVDACQFARDMGFNGVTWAEMMSCVVYGIALDELRSIILSGSLKEQELRDLDYELLLLDKYFPSHSHTLSNEALVIAMGFVKLDESSPAFILFRGLNRLMVSDAVESLEGFVKRRVAAEELSWLEIQKVVIELSSEGGRSLNPLTKAASPAVIQSGAVVRERRAQLNLLRVAVTFLRSGEVPEVDDPFGSKLHTSRAGNKLKAWSIGRDGHDHGGNGEWKGDGGKDIVLEVTG